MQIAFLGAALLLAGSAFAIYEEQAGFLDWHKENIGSVTHAQFAFRGRERVFVATASAVIASLDTKDGAIAWRQVLEEGDVIDALVLVPRPASVLTLSRGGSLLRAWHALDGTLLWEKALSGGSGEGGGGVPQVVVLPDVSGDGSSDIAVASGTKLQVLSGPRGKLIWSATLPGVAVAASLGSPSEGGTSILVAHSQAGVVEVDAFEASTGAQQGVSSRLASDVLQTALSPSHAAALTADGYLCGLVLGGGKPHCESLLAADSGLQGFTLGAFLAPGKIAVHSHGQTVLGDIAAGSITLTHREGFTASSLLDDEPGVGVFAGTAASGAMKVMTVDFRSGKVSEQPAVDAGLTTAGGRAVRVRQVVAGSRKVVVPQKPTATVQRYLVALEDDSLLLVEDSKLVWRREEGLASVLHTLFLDLPVATPDLEARFAAEKPTLKDRAYAEFLSIKKSLGVILPEEDGVLLDINSRLSSHLLPHRDSNGFRKLILLLSASGKLFAVHSGNGRLVWSLTLDREVPLTSLFLGVSSHDPGHAPIVLLLGSTAQRGVSMAVNGHTGDVLDIQTLPGSIEKVVKLPGTIRDKTADYHSFALVTSDLGVTSLPGSASRAFGQPFYFWRHNKEKGALEGYKVSPGGGEAEEQWSVAFAEPGNEILHVAGRDPEEHVYSYAKVLGNRSMKLKYLNPNIVFVVAGQSADAPAGSEEASLTVQLLDSVSGHILYRQTLEGARGPATAALSENWVVYSYYSTRNQRFELAVLEFYDVQPRDLSIPSLLLGNQSTTLSPFAPTPIEVLHQSYFTPVGIKTMAVTSTRRGITSKQLLLGTEANQVYLMDKRFLDPRRPKGVPTAEEKAEMLPPYADELPFAPQLYASHKEIIEGLRGIATSPANLESTTLTLTHGLDLFFTRVQPSQTFDLLPDDFPFAMLVTVTAVLTVGAFVLKRLEDSSAVKRKWT